MDRRTGPLGVLFALALVLGGAVACTVAALTVPGGAPAILGTGFCAALVPAVLHEA